MTLPARLVDEIVIHHCPGDDGKGLAKGVGRGKHFSGYVAYKGKGGMFSHPRPNVQSVVIDHQQVNINDEANAAQWDNFPKFYDAV